MSSRSQETIYLKDYTPPEFTVLDVDLKFDIFSDHTLVNNRMSLRRLKSGADLVLDGIDLELISLKMNEKELDSNSYKKTDATLSIENVDDEFQLEVVTKIYPQKNKSYEGLYCSNKTLVTQMEAQGFRKATYFIDRPDMMTKFSTTITANKGEYPALLSNGNLVQSEDLDGGRHLARWVDPFKKPAYLFAIVAGDLGMIQDEFVTMSGRKVDLRIYCEKGAEKRCLHAMHALKLSMKWDEEKFNREYDLDIYMIVAVDDFNAGAMENKGLNIFNSVYIHADAETATDVDYERILGVVGHEYFHNWTGNRITLRDWFQLSLKEGLTVFRDQEFTADMSSRAVKRIDDVNVLRNRQFAEDAGPTAHPVRPSSVISVDNFFTVTIYEKGSELIHMYQTLLGREGFRKGMDLYFERHDEQAVTIDDFASAMEDANQADLTQFKLWYDQAGTPVVKATGNYDQENKKYELTLEQSCPPTPEQKNKKPFHIPIKMGLLGKDGSDLSLNKEGEKETVLHLKGSKQNFIFEDINEKPVPSLLRGFSAPIHLEDDKTLEEQAFLLANDSDSFSRWEAGQTLVLKSILNSLKQNKTEAPELVTNAFKKVIENKELDPAFKARLLMLPDESYIAQFMEQIDVTGIHKTRDAFLKSIANSATDQIEEIYNENQSDKYEITPEAIGRRTLKNVMLNYLMNTGDKKWITVAEKQLRESGNMTDELSALTCLLHRDGEHRQNAIQHFKTKWEKESLVMNKLLRTIATSPLDGTLDEVKRYMQEPIFNSDNPNKVYALIMGFGLLNPTQFHRESGQGYEFLAEQVLVFDKKNPHVASSLASSFNHWKKFDNPRRDFMRQQMEKICKTEGLSGNTFEIISKNLEV